MTLKCFLTDSPAPHGCSRRACAACARVVEMVAELDAPRPRDLDFDVPDNILRAAKQAAAATDAPLSPLEPTRRPQNC